MGPLAIRRSTRRVRRHAAGLLLADDDEVMHNCARTCRRCAESCRRMAAA